MLQLICGKSGTGKTYNVLQMAKKLANEDKKSIIIIPEQASFDTEREINRLVRGEKGQNIEVYSFTRLCTRIFETFGQICGKYISETGKIISMNLAIDEIKDKLSVYEKASKSNDFSENMLSVIDELKASGVTSDVITSNILNIEDTTLKDKLNELSLIYDTYGAFIETKYKDSSDNILRAINLLKNNNFFGDYTVFIDGFMTFMSGEYSFLEEILRQCEDMFVTITAPYPFQDKSIINGFTASTINANRLISIAKKCDIISKVPINLLKDYRHQNDELLFLSENFEDIEEKKFDTNINLKAEDYSCDKATIQTIKCKNILSELSFVGATISHLVKEKGERYKNIAVVARDLSPYENYIKDIFDTYEIPFFMDMRKEISYTAIILFVLNSIEVAVNGFKTEKILSLGKSPCLNFDILDLSNLQNYAYMWGIDGPLWKSDFSGKIKGISKVNTQEDIVALEKINETRRKIVEPLLSLKEKIKNTTGEEFAQAIYEYILETNSTENLKEYYKNHTDNDKIIQDNNKAFECMIDVLEDFALLVGEKEQSAKNNFELLKKCIDTIDVGEIPQTQDQVFVGLADRIRINDITTVFVIGANFGKFPKTVTASSSFTDDELEKMKQAGIEVGNTSLHKNLYEKFYCYFALTMPSQRLFVTYHTYDLESADCGRSEIVSKIESMFDNSSIDLNEINDEYFAVNKEKVFEILCSRANENSQFTTTLKKFVCDNEMEKRLNRVFLSKEKQDYKIKNKDIARRLFGDEISISPSQAEKYFSCPFSYFCQKGLGLRPIRKIEFSPLESGTIIHYVLEKVLKDYTKDEIISLTCEQIENIVDGYLNQFFKEFLGEETELSNRYIYLFERLKGLLTRVVMNICDELSQSKFVPKEFEMKISKDGEIPPVVIEIKDGAKVIVEGIVDRVDVFEHNGKRYIRVIDYKSGTKEFDICKVADGFDMQMLLYLFSICENYKEKEKNVPAGVLYLPAKDSVISVLRETKDQEIATMQEKKLKRSGIVLNEETCLRAMEECLQGRFIPAKEKKSDGFELSKVGTSVASLDEFEILRSFIAKKIAQVGEGLLDGKIEALPMKMPSFLPCDYCEYRLVCEIEDKDEKNSLKKVSKDKIFDYLKGDEIDG